MCIYVEGEQVDSYKALGEILVLKISSIDRTVYGALRTHPPGDAMQALTLEHFLKADSDFETAQYQVLGGLQTFRHAFANNHIYPYLGGLVKLYHTLHSIVGQIDDLRDAAPAQLTGIDLEAGALHYERGELSDDQIAFVEDLIRWALPHLQQAIEEGRTIYEFVEEHLELEEVGIVPSYLEEGYLFVPDRQTSSLHVLQYSLSVFTDAGERYRSLKTVHVKSVFRRNITPSPQSLKLELLSEKRDLPNPATYAFESELDFPFDTTMLPVAKRKLIRYLSRIEGQA